MISPLSRLRALRTAALTALDTPRKRLVAGIAAAGLLAALGYGLYSWLAPQRLDYSRAWFSREYVTDNRIHPVHLSLTHDDPNTYDLLMVQNLANKPLSLMAFSSRPRGGSANDPMGAWASWMTATNTAVTINPGYTFLLRPGDLERSALWHGHTWLAIYYEPGSLTDPQPVSPAAILPDGWTGHFRVTYCRSQLAESWLAAPATFRTQLNNTLSSQIDQAGKTTYMLDPLDLTPLNGLTSEELR